MKTLKGSKGMALVMVLMIMMLLLSISGAALLFSGMNLRTTTNFKQRNSVFHIADAGLNHGWQELANNDGTNDFTAVLTNGGASPLVSNMSFAGGSYTVVATQTGSNLKLTSTGCIPGSNPCASGSVKAVIEAIVQKSVSPPTDAVTNAGNLSLTLSSKMKLTGVCGSLHTNGALTISGDAGAEKANGFTSSGTMDISGNPCVGNSGCGSDSPPPAYVLDTNSEKDAYEAANQSKPTKALPVINPADFAQRVANLGLAGKGYILNNNGKITVNATCGSNGLCEGGTELSGTDKPAGWEWDWTSWTVPNDTVANGVFYAETPVYISGNPGTTSTPWESTIIARDSIEWSGNPVTKPFNPPSDTDLQGIHVVTGNDLKVNGNIGMIGQEGAILVHQQIGVSGNPTLYGFLQIGNGSPTWSGDPFPTSTSGKNHYDSSTFSGDAKISYSCSANCTHAACGNTTAKMVAGSWRDVF
jgi:Tfp pilus assembly protein PilX